MPSFHDFSTPDAPYKASRAISRQIVLIAQ